MTDDRDKIATTTTKTTTETIYTTSINTTTDFGLGRFDNNSQLKHALYIVLTIYAN